MRWLGYHGIKTSRLNAFCVTYSIQGFQTPSNLVIVSSSIADILAYIIAVFIMLIVSFKLKFGDFQAFAIVCFAAVRSCFVKVKRAYGILSGFKLRRAVLGSKGTVLFVRISMILKISSQNFCTFGHDHQV